VLSNKLPNVTNVNLKLYSSSSSTDTSCWQVS